MDKIILALYINQQAIDEFVKYQQGKLDEIFNHEKYILTFFSTEGESRIECVYPKFIGSSKFVEENKQYLEDLNEKIKQLINHE